MYTLKVAALIIANSNFASEAKSLNMQKLNLRNIFRIYITQSNQTFDVTIKTLTFGLHGRK